MEKVFEWHHSLYYGERLGLDDFDTKSTKSLDSLLRAICMVEPTSYKTEFRMKALLPSLNAAYYVAACLANAESLDIAELYDEIGLVIRLHWDEYFQENLKYPYPCRCTFLYLMLIKWMVYGILHSQANKSREMVAFLDGFRRKLIGERRYDGRDGSDVYDYLHLLGIVERTIDEWPYRYHTDLRPNPLHPRHYTLNLWYKSVRNYDMDQIERQLRLFRTKEEQLAFLDWAREASRQPQPVFVDDDFETI